MRWLDVSMDILAAEVVVPPRPRRMSLAWSLCSWVTPELELTSGAVLATRGRPSDMRATKVSSGGIFVVVVVGVVCYISCLFRFSVYHRFVEWYIIYRWQ